MVMVRNELFGQLERSIKLKLLNRKKEKFKCLYFIRKNDHQLTRIGKEHKPTKRMNRQFTE